MRNFKLFLTPDEQQTLENLGDSEEYAKLLWNITLPDNGPNSFVLDRADAFEWKDVVERARGILPRAQGTLRTKLTKLYEQIH